MIIRIHLATGASVRYMALGEGEQYPENNEYVSTSSINQFIIANVQLEKTGTVDLGLSILKNFALIKDELLMIEKNGTHLYVNTAERQASSGDYVLDIDGVISVNYLQRS